MWISPTSFCLKATDFTSIEVGIDVYPALAVGGSEDLDTKGAYAIELYSDDAADIAALAGQSVQAYAFSGDDYILSENAVEIQ